MIAFATRPREAIAKVTVEDPLSNTTVLNSLPVKLAPANVMVWSELALNVTTAVPAPHEAEVEVFVQFPETVHASEPKTMYDDADETFTFPVTETLPDVEVSDPPVNVMSPFTVKV